MLVLKILAAYGFCALLVSAIIIISFRRQLGEYIRYLWRKRPIDYPVWVYRLRRWWRIEWQQMKNRRDQIGGILFVFAVLGLLALGLIVSCPS